jgi:hypothetical protein
MSFATPVSLAGFVKIKPPHELCLDALLIIEKCGRVLGKFVSQFFLLAALVGEMKNPVEQSFQILPNLVGGMIDQGLTYRLTCLWYWAWRLVTSSEEPHLEVKSGKDFGNPDVCRVIASSPLVIPIVSANNHLSLCNYLESILKMNLSGLEVSTKEVHADENYTCDQSDAE